LRGPVALAQRRLAIIDVAGGWNPLLESSGRAALMFNGEIWNYRELRAELEAAGARPLSHCDAEVILHGYLHWGLRRTLERLRGMYAFALHDLRDGSVHLARDPLGIKPLFLHHDALGLVFGSEMKSVIAALPARPAVDRAGLFQCATLGFVLAPRTIFEGIESLPPGSSLSLQDNRATRSRFHALRFEPGRERADPEELWSRLRATVESHLMSEVPLGAFLSGGVDSSAIVTAMAELRGGDVDAVCVGILEPGMDERPHARAVAAGLGIRLHESEAAPELLDLLPRLAWHLEMPFGDTSAAPTWLVCQAARRHVTVALSGDGGDENFAGYRRTRYDVLEDRWRRALPAALRTGLLGPLGRAWPRAPWIPRPLRAGTLLTNLADDWLDAYVRSLSRVGEAAARALLRPEVADAAPLRAAFEPHAAAAAHLDPLHRVLAMDFATWLPDDILVKADRMSMAHGLEVRVPLLDTDFVGWAAGLPAEAKLSGGGGKALFRRALEGRVPAQVLHRTKQGFHLPVDRWLRTGLAGRMDELLAQRGAAVFDLVDSARVAALWSAHRAGTADRSTELWFTLSLDAFLRAPFAPRRGGAA
ncbi:MAG TPA: asparagine synthase (glutamine-hydrolyzing), partial [Planctomycetota bacterium]|nr:asparagine synthase (glutamine-hydrolyzing) [Planctomycetota bacterium]